MKYNYEFLDETIEIEVSEEWAAVLFEMDRIEYNNNHTETRRHTPLDTTKDKRRALISSEPDLADLMILKEEVQIVEEAIKDLSPAQQEVIEAVCYCGMSVSDFAVSKGMSQPAASDRLMKARKKLKKLL